MLRHNVKKTAVLLHFGVGTDITVVVQFDIVHHYAAASNVLSRFVACFGSSFHRRSAGEMRIDIGVLVAVASRVLYRSFCLVVAGHFSLTKSTMY